MARSGAIQSPKEALWQLASALAAAEEPRLIAALRKIDAKKQHQGIWSRRGLEGRQLGFVTAAGSDAHQGGYLSHIYSGAYQAKDAKYLGYMVDDTVMKQLSKGVYQSAGKWVKRGNEYDIIRYFRDRELKAGILRADGAIDALEDGKLRRVGFTRSPDEAAAYLLVIHGKATGAGAKK